MERNVSPSPLCVLRLKCMCAAYLKSCRARAMSDVPTVEESEQLDTANE